MLKYSLSHVLREILDNFAGVLMSVQWQFLHLTMDIKITIGESNLG